MSFTLNGKTAIVTGAASGLGLAVARHFVERGARVMFADQDEERLAAEIGTIDENSPLRVFSCDLRQKLAVSNLIAATYDAFERVDILVNAARFVDICDPLVSEGDKVDLHWQANVMATLRLSQQVAKRMIERAREDGEAEGDAGTIINVASLISNRSRPELMGVAIASAGVEQMTRSLALALAPQRVRVNAIAMASVMTANLQAALKEKPEMRDQMTAMTPLRRIASLREVTETVQFLASDASSFMTGQILRIDGGRSLLEPVPGPFQ